MARHDGRVAGSDVIAGVAGTGVVALVTSVVSCCRKCAAACSIFQRASVRLMASLPELDDAHAVRDVRDRRISLSISPEFQVELPTWRGADVFLLWSVGIYWLLGLRHQ